MSRTRCEREAEVLAALRQSSAHADLDLHVATCAACTETRRVAGWMIRQAATLSKVPLPAPDQIWRRAQAQKQALVLQRAARVMTILRVACVLYAAGFATWCVRVPCHAQLRSITLLLSALARPSVYAGAAIAITTVAIGAGCLLLLGKRDGTLTALN